MQKEQRGKPMFWYDLDFYILHLTPLAIFFTGITWFDFILCIGLYFGRMFFVAAGYHRYFSHKTYKTSRWFQFVLAFLAQTSLQKGALWWASIHRMHHKHSDKPEDPHSAKLYGFWYSHMGWILGPDFKNTRYDLINEWTRFKELVILNRLHYIPGLLLALVVWGIGNAYHGTGIFDLGAGLSTLVVGFFLSTIILYHGTFTINSLMHKIGKRRFPTDDNSKNSFWLALLTLGEGWHNNHHYFQSSVRQGFVWWEVDITYYILKVFSWFGLVWDMRKVPDRVMAQRDKLDD